MRWYDSMSFGAILTRPSGAAVPTKNTFCFVMNSWCASEISLNLGICLGLLWCVAHFVSWRFCRELSSSDDKLGLVGEMARTIAIRPHFCPNGSLRFFLSL